MTSHSFDLEKYLEPKLDLKQVDDSECVTECPKCGDYKQRLYINFQKNVAHCQHCKWSPRSVNFVMFYEGLPYAQAQQFIKNQPLTVDPDFDLNQELEAMAAPTEWKLKTDPLIEVPYPSFAVKLGPSVHPRWVKNKMVLHASRYLQQRGVTLDDMQRLGFLAVIHGKKKGRIAIPVVLDGTIYSWVYRDFTGKSSKLDEKGKPLIPKVLNERGSQQRRLLFNFDEAVKHENVVVTEGVFDAVRVGKEAVASFGNKLSDDQLELLVQAPFKNIVMLYDADAKKNMIKAAERLQARAELKATVRCVYLNSGDPGDTPTSTLRSMIVKASPYKDADSIQRLI